MQKKIKLHMSVELNVKVDDRLDQERQLDTIMMFARNYMSCLGDKDIKLDDVEVR